MEKINEATIVSAYYELCGKKHKPEDYYYYMKKLLIINCYMIIYVGNKEIAEKMKEYRKGLEDKTLIIILPIEELYCSKFMSYWKKDYDRDHERYHDPSMYIVWNEKTTFIKKAKDLNPFNTEYYCWTDIGCVRDDYYLNFINTFPSKNMLSICDKNKVYLLNLFPYSEEEKNTVKDATENFRYKDNTGATLIMCHKDIVDTWYTTYYNMLDRFMELDLFAGKEQSIINCICLVHPDLVKLIKPINPPFDKWFYMLFYFSDYYYYNLRHIQ